MLEVYILAIDGPWLIAQAESITEMRNTAGVGLYIFMSKMQRECVKRVNVSLTIFIKNAFMYCSGCAKGTVSGFLLLQLFPLSQFLRTISFCFYHCNKGLQTIQSFYKLY